MSNKVTSEEDLKAKVNAFRSIAGHDKLAINEVISRNILHTDLGYFTDPQTTYNLDEETRDRLIVHTRHDAASTTLAAITLSKEIDKLKRLAKISIYLLTIITLIMIIHMIS